MEETLQFGRAQLKQAMVYYGMFEVCALMSVSKRVDVERMA